MRARVLIAIGAVLFFCGRDGAADDTGRVRKAIEKSTLDQPGTKPFHLKATVGPIRAQDADAAERTGSIEIWWESPSRWRREVRSPQFSQVEIVNEGKDWQKNEGDYFPEWLREAAVVLVRPVPDVEGLLDRLKGAEVRQLLGVTHYSWVTMGSDGKVSKGIGAAISIREDGLIQDGSGLGFSVFFEVPAGSKEPFQDFHGRKVGRRIECGSVVDAVTLLEDLKGTPAGFFEVPAAGGDAALQTLVVAELAERENLIPGPAPTWPALEQGPLEGVMLAEVGIDRTGKVRNVPIVLSDNPGLNDVAKTQVEAMRFKPMLLNGQPVQVVTTITMPFKTSRPAGVESFEAARNYFDRARRMGYAVPEGGAPYVLKAEFEASGAAHVVSKGTYTDTWLSDTKWKREAVFGSSRLVRSREGDRRYLVSEGDDAKLLGALFDLIEPIPDTSGGWYDADWRVKRDQVGGVNTLRVVRGPESPDGRLDGEGFWFDETGRLVKAHVRGLDVRELNFEEFGGRQVARTVEVYANGKLALRVRVTSVVVPAPQDEGSFSLSGHEWTRQFTAEMR
jgi:TonB family protein